jgi:HlyD family secretion protein
MNDTSPKPVSSQPRSALLTRAGPLGSAAVLRRPAVRYALAAAGIVAAVALGLSIYANRPIAVQVASIESNVPVRVFGLGTVEARVLSKIGFEVGATLVELNADHGDRVSKGQVLARLSAGEQEAKVAKARAALFIAEVNIGKSAANVEKTQAVLAQKQEANRRKKVLVGRDIVSQQAAEAMSEAESAKAQVADARAQLLFEETMLRHRTLVAPYDAVIIERHKEPGTVIKAGDSVFTLVAVGTYWGLAYVDEARAGFIAEGQPVEARLRSRPLESFKGRVVRIGLESDRVTEERRVYLRGENPPPQIYLGEQAEFWITVATLDKALLVPAAAVHGFNGREGTVWTLEGGRLHKQLVKFRHRTEDARLEIVDGLPEAARVVIRSDSSFRAGRSARVSEARIEAAGR